MYQMPGTEYSRCMSLERIGLPLAVCRPESAQALDPGLVSPVPCEGYRNWTFSRLPCESSALFTISSFQVVVRLRYM